MTGDDSNDGLTPATAFRTIAAGAAHASYGITVYIEGGTY
jgi:hypothetical protein